MPNPPASSAAPVPAPDDFDAILAAPGSATSAALSSRAPGAATSAASGSLRAREVAANALSSSASAGAQVTQAERPAFAEFAAHWALYRDPVLAGSFAGLTLGVVGVFIVLRRAVFVTAAVSQAAGLGVASAFLLAIFTGFEFPPVLLAFVFAGLSALALAIRPPARLPREATVGFVYLVSSAFAIIVGDRISQEAHDIAAILFGTAVLVRPADLLFVTVVGTLALAGVVTASRGLLFAGFDADAARVQRVPVQRLETGLWLLVAAEVAVATRALGALPVFAFAVLPALGALRLSKRLPEALLFGGAAGAFSGGAGYVAAFLLELPVGASQATLAALVTLGAFVAGRLRN